MKKMLKQMAFLLMGIPLLLLGCSKSEVTDTTSTNPDNNAVKTGIAYCGTPVTVNLYTYQGTTSCGTATIGNDGNKLYVSFTLSDNWMIYRDVTKWETGANLFVGSEAELIALQPGTVVNSNGTGHFYLWRFPYQYLPVGLNEQSHTFEINRSDIGEDCPFIVLGIRVKDYSTNQVVTVSARANTKCWAHWIQYCFQSCGNTETAYAKADDPASTCFLNLPSPGANSNNWGWSNLITASSVPYTFHWPIYAGAGQCSISNATHVGYLDGTYDGANVYVTYNLFGGFHLNSTALWVGNDYLPLKKGKYNTAPGQFPYKHSSLNGAGTDSFGPIPITGDVYIAAHSDVVW